MRDYWASFDDDRDGGYWGGHWGGHWGSGHWGGYGWGGYWWGCGGGCWHAEPSVIAPEVTLTPAYQPLEGLLLGDQTADKVFLLRDLNGDGDATDADERIVFFDETNASGLPTPTGSVFNIHQASDGFVYVGDGVSDSIYRLRDLNGDGDANDAGEANVWFSSANAEALPFVTPNGIAEGPDGAIYLVNPGVIAGPVEDAVYRTIDLNGDGDAQDAGESSVWLDLQILNPSSSAFDISFADGVAYISDTNGGDPNTIYRAEDIDGSGAIEAGEASVFISESNSFGAPIDFAHAVDGDSILTWEFIGSGGISSVFRLTDLNGSGDIDQASEAVEVWNTSLLPSGFRNFVGFSIAADGNGNVAVTSNGGSADQRNVFRLTDLNGDGDFLDPGETIVAASNLLDPDVGQRPRALAFYDDGTPDPHPLTYDEGGPAVRFAEDLTLSDPDSTWICGAEIRIVGGLDPEHDLLSVELPRYGPIRSYYDADSGTLRLKGRASAEDYQEALRSLSFQSRVDDPDEALRQIEITVQDERGAEGSSVAVATTLAVQADLEIETVFGGKRGDWLRGDGDDNRILGGRGNDIIKGRGGDDSLFGEEGYDILIGGRGDDLLSGGPGFDIVRGGKGADRFLFTGESDTDVIKDFDLLEDEIVFDGVTLGGETILTLADAAPAAQSFGPTLTRFEFDNDATLWVFSTSELPIV